MSTQVNQYYCYGYYFPYSIKNFIIEKIGIDAYEKFCDDIYDSAFDSKINIYNNISGLFDGCNCEYIFLGKIFLKSKNYEYLNILKLPKISLKDKANIKLSLLDILPETEISKYKPQYILLSHYR